MDQVMRGDDEVVNRTDRHATAPVIGFVRRTWVLYLLVLPLPVYYMVVADRMDPRSVVLPRLIAWAMVAFAALIAVNDWRTARTSSPQPLDVRGFWATWRKTVGVIALTAALVAGFGWIGFYPAAAVFLLVCFTLLEAGGAIKRIVSTGAVLAGCYVLFEVVLGVRLP